MMIFTMMALGLNFVVGYAGLLDLGYVAFYAIGRLHGRAGSRRRSSRSRTSTSAPSASIPDATGFHFSIWLVLPMAGIATAVRRRRSSACRRCACAATISRSSRSASARSCRRSRGTATTSSAPASTSRTARAASRRSTARASATGSTTHSRLPANYLTAAQPATTVFFWTALVLVLITVFCSSRAARLAARPRVDRDPRGRDRRRRDGRAADADEDVGVRDRRVLRRRRRRVLRVVQERRRSPTTSSSTSPSSSSAW